MKAMLLAAGEGRRMRPLTLHTPKPLLVVGDKPLIEHHLRAIVAAGIEDVVINVSYLGEKIERALGDGAELGLKITYSREPEPLETAGGILNAMHILGDAPFLLVNGDVWTDFPLAAFAQVPLNAGVNAHLIMVNNPAHNPQGDFAIDNHGYLVEKSVHASCMGLTYSGIAMLRPEALTTYPQKRSKFALREVFQNLISARAITAEHYSGRWCDVGTPERLAQLNSELI